jgi:hypothetical protein
MEISVRNEALTWASEQFGRAYADIGGVSRAICQACGTGAPSLGDARAGAALTSLSTRVTGLLDETCAQLLDLASGLRRAIETYQNADHNAIGAEPSVRPGGPR